MSMRYNKLLLRMTGQFIDMDAKSHVVVIGENSTAKTMSIGRATSVLTKYHVLTRIIPMFYSSTQTTVPHYTDSECKKHPGYAVDIVVNHLRTSNNLVRRIPRNHFAAGKHTWKPTSHIPRQFNG